MTRLRLFLFLLTTAFVIGVGLLVSLIARGYRFDTKTIGLRPTGLLVITSVPDGAQILINGELESATNATISLPPNTYDVEVRRDGFIPWRKRLTIMKEEVTKEDIVLFPAAPSLSALTFTGAEKPILSPDGTKIAYAVPRRNDTAAEIRPGLWVMDLADLPIGFSREPRQITDASLDGATWQWSPDSRQILLETLRGTFLVNTGTLTPQTTLVNIEGTRLTEILETWEEQRQKKLEAQLSRVPEVMRDILGRKAKDLVFSPDDTRVLYTASSSAQIPEGLVSPLPGSSTQKQERNIKEGHTYVYDIKEDRNFLVYDKEASLGYNEDTKAILRWFPTSRHLVLAEEDKISIMDYDGTNRQVVWGGPYVAPFALPFPNTTRLLILTSLGAGNGNQTNLYALSLR